ncbi:MAG TPA: arginase [Flavobacteriales bacterium]|nr:arginase [Flavobacteriales bacterium]|tara:strand:+ start:1644 stop:2804 length:1161 start_codon:yes stop_codon:yes gene_type:complete
MLDGIYDLFESVTTPHYSNAEGSQRIAERIDVHQFDYRPQLEGARVALFGVMDGRKSGDNEGCSEGPAQIRDALYRLTPHANWQTTIDLGDLRPGATETDTAAAVQSVVAELTQQGIIPIVLGGGQDLTTALYLALQPFGKPVQLVTMDPRLDFGADPSQGNSRNFMNDIILHEPNYLFTYTNLGHQGYLTDPDTLELLDKMQFESIRLGEINQNPALMEPILRDADLISIDTSVIQGSDHLAHSDVGPNGIDARTICQLARYAGMSDQMKAIGIFEHNPELDNRNLGSQLVGQIVWHILDGIYAQKSDYPKCELDEYARYVVDLNDVDQALVFYKSSKSDRWWMEVPFKGQKTKVHIVGCAYEDYVEASEGKMPDRWWRTLQKLN